MSMAQTRPNILLITADTLRTDALSCYGSSFAHSPHLDRLAREGVLFTQAHSNAPVCMPARCSILSGLHTPAHGCTENGILPYSHMPAFTDTLKSLGYQTIMVGKTHFGPVPDSFDQVYEAAGEKESNFTDCFAEEMERDGFARKSCFCKEIPVGGHLDTYIVERLLKQLDKRRKAQPFFAFCSLLSPHSPLDPPGEFRGLYSAKEIPPADFRPDEWRTQPALIREICGLPNPSQKSAMWEDGLNEALGNIADGLQQEEIRRYKAVYYSLAAFCDALVGKILAYLDTQGLRENTLILFTADHGQQYFDHGFNDKHNYYDASLRVPLIMSMPGTLPENETRSFASLIDLAPTITAAAGAGYPRGHGLDLYTPLLQRLPSPRCYAAAAFYGSAAIVSHSWKLAIYFDSGETQLFHRINDPKEYHNLAQSPRYLRLQKTLLQGILCWYSGLINQKEFQTRLTKGGPAAQRIYAQLHAAAGNHPELLLNSLIKEMDFVHV